MKLEFLVENRIDFIAEKQGPAMEQRILRGGKNIEGNNFPPDNTVQAFLQSRGIEEPERRDGREKVNIPQLLNIMFEVVGKYLQFVVNWYIKGDFMFEDLERVKRVIEAFNAHKHQIEQKDISRYPSFHQLEAAVDAATVKPVEKEMSGKETARKLKEGAEKIYEDENLLVLIPRTYEAATFYGKNTKWCTTGENSSGPGNFNMYTKQGPLFIIIDKTDNKKYQWHFPSKQFKDATDREYDIKKLVDKFPVLCDIFEKQAMEYAKVPLFGPKLRAKVLKGAIDIMKKPKGDEVVEVDDPLSTITTNAWEQLRAKLHLDAHEEFAQLVFTDENVRSMLAKMPNTIEAIKKDLSIFNKTRDIILGKKVKA